MSIKYKATYLVILFIILSSTISLAQDKDSSFVNRFNLRMNYGYMGDLSYVFDNINDIMPPPVNKEVTKIHSGWAASIGLFFELGKSKPYKNDIGFTFLKGITKGRYLIPAQGFFNAIRYDTWNNYEIMYHRKFGNHRWTLSPGLGFYLNTLKSQEPEYQVIPDNTGYSHLELFGWNNWKDVAAPGITAEVLGKYQLHKNAAIGLQLKVNYSLYWYFENFMLAPFIEIKL